MKKASLKRFSEFIEIALRSGATAARIIPSTQVVVDERVRLKCEVPKCAGYGQYLTCPPHVMSVDTFSRVLSGYKWGLVVQVEAKGIDSTDKGKGRIHQAILRENRELHRSFKLKILEIVEAVDVSTTLCSLAGIELLETSAGKDLSHLLRGGHGEVHEIGVTEFAWSKSIRKGHYRLVYYPREMFPQDYPGGFGELYDLEEDPWEMHNLFFAPHHAHQHFPPFPNLGHILKQEIGWTWQPIPKNPKLISD